MDHFLGSACHQRHVQRIEHQLCGERGGHRPADDATAEGVEHDREIEEARPGGNVSDIRHPQPIRRLCSEITLDQIRCLAAVALHRRHDELAAGHTGKASLRHQPCDALATEANGLGRQFGMNARRAVATARGRMCCMDLSR